MNAIFLDIDGVLNNDKTREITPDGFTGIDDYLVERLSRIVKETDSKILLSSSWRFSYLRDKPIKTYLDNKFAKYDISVYGTTLPDDYLEKNMSRNSDFAFECYRGKQIDFYLQNHPEVEEYLVLDDETFEFDKYTLNLHFISTDYKVGLTEDNIEKCIAILKGNLDWHTVINNQEMYDHFGRDLVDTYS